MSILKRYYFFVLISLYFMDEVYGRKGAHIGDNATGFNLFIIILGRYLLVKYHKVVKNPVIQCGMTISI